MMQQYKAIKEEHQDAILFFRLGDFYEMFFDDAREAAGILSLVLTARNGVPMCGIPYHAAKNYIKRLIDAGKKIAICEQTQLPEKGKTLATREVVQIITPGTVVEDDYLDASRNNYLCCVYVKYDRVSCAYADLSTGDFYLTGIGSGFEYSELRSLLGKLQPSELIVEESRYYEDESFRKTVAASASMKTTYPDWYFSLENSRDLLNSHLQTMSLKSFGLEDDSPLIIPAGVLLGYIQEHAKQELDHINELHVVSTDEFLLMDESAQRNLELLKNLSDGSERYSLFSVLKQTKSAAGARLLKQWIVNPLRNIDAIIERQQQVRDFYGNQAVLTASRQAFSQVLDIQRITTRISMRRASPRDLQAVSQTVRSVLDLFGEYPDFFPEVSRGQSLRELAETIDAALQDEITGMFEEGKIIRDGFDAQLDELREMRDHGQQMLEAYLDEIKVETGITNMRLKSNKILGHFIEVSKAQTKLVPDSFYRKQTLVNGERYTTDRLIELERTIEHARQSSGELEKSLYEKLVEDADSLRPELLELAAVAAELDCYQSLAFAAMRYGYVCPELDEFNRLEIVNGRHPVVESLMTPGEFVPNSVNIAAEYQRTALITGPNMSGKSTYLRQTALIVLMAHIGSFVPADSARIGLTDKIFCRVGASDNLARGESTFLVEMNETAFILRHATEHSLVIMDEVGRGTSTRDGLSIAYAVLQKLLAIRSKTLFATHYHELTVYESPMLQKLYLDIAEHDGSMIFLKQVRSGVASSSYGIHAAQLAGVPRDVLSAARRFQKELSSDRLQPDLFDRLAQQEEQLEPHVNQEILDKLERIDLNGMTPLEALQFLAQIQKELKN
jgi:DNA mismatch repair protein MutS